MRCEDFLWDLPRFICRFYRRGAVSLALKPVRPFICIWLVRNLANTPLLTIFCTAALLTSLAVDYWVDYGIIFWDLIQDAWLKGVCKIVSTVRWCCSLPRLIPQEHLFFLILSKLDSCRTLLKAIIRRKLNRMLGFWRCMYMSSIFGLGLQFLFQLVSNLSDRLLGCLLCLRTRCIFN